MRFGRRGSIAISAGVGLCCTVGAAWAVALLGDLHTFRGQYRTGAELWRTPGYLSDVLPEPRAGRVMPGRAVGYRLYGTDFPIPTGEASLQAGWFTVWTSEFGWPWYALRWDELRFRPMHDDRAKERIAAVQGAFDDRARWRAGVALPFMRTASGSPRMLPLAPVWGGMAAGVAAYGSVFWAAVFGPGEVRRWARRRRGACVRCGYDVRGLAGCPECGAGGAGGGGGGGGGGGRAA